MPESGEKPTGPANHSAGPEPFLIKFPYRNDEETTGATTVTNDARVSRRSDGRQPHVMVLDSSRLILEVMRELLAFDCYAVTATTFAPGSFAEIEALQPSLLIIDLAIHERMGWELLERLADDALTRAIPVIVTSTDPRLLERAEESRTRFGGDGWIAKPFDIDVLLGLVHDLAGIR